MSIDAIRCFGPGPASITDVPAIGIEAVVIVNCGLVQANIDNYHRETGAYK
jgi:hypothetical protein